jgi:hypothetical protein
MSAQVDNQRGNDTYQKCNLCPVVHHGDQDPLWGYPLSQDTHMNHPTVLKILEQILNLLIGLSMAHSF